MLIGNWLKTKLNKKISLVTKKIVPITQFVKIQCLGEMLICYEIVIICYSVHLAHPVPLPDAGGADLPQWVHLVGGLRCLGKVHLHCLSI